MARGLLRVCCHIIVPKTDIKHVPNVLNGVLIELLCTLSGVYVCYYNHFSLRISYTSAKQAAAQIIEVKPYTLHPKPKP